MRRTMPCLLLLLTSLAQAAEAPISAELATPMTRLAAAIDRLGAAMEKQAVQEEATGERDRVQVALGILGLRMRKVERLESGVQNLKAETDDLRNQAGSIKTTLSRPGMQEDSLHAELERSLAMIESRIVSLEERRSMMQADLDRELRGLSRLEAILDDWLKKQD